jgi:hypothetical protein
MYVTIVEALLMVAILIHDNMVLASNGANKNDKQGSKAE